MAIGPRTTLGRHRQEKNQIAAARAVLVKADQVAPATL